MTRSDLTRRAFCASAPAVLPSPVLAPPTADPTFALIARWKLAHVAFELACAAPGGARHDSPACTRAWSRMEAAEAALAACHPTTPAGLAAHIAWALEASRDGEAMTDATLAALRSCARAAAAMHRPAGPAFV